VSILKLTNTHLVALVDSEDYNRVSSRSWRLTVNHTGNLYVVSDVRHTDHIEKILLHREILRTYDDSMVDHVDGNGLDNRKYNLRVATNQQNVANSHKWRKQTSSRYKGVFWDHSRGLWRAGIMFNRKKIYLGRYLREEEAAQAYDNRAVDLFGEFARLNFPRARTVFDVG